MMQTEQKKPPRIGIVGCGAIAEKYYLPAFARIPGSTNNLILVDTHADRMQALATKFGVLQCINNYRELFDKVEGVILAVPHQLHYPMSMEFLGHGIHVLCEKPLAETAADVKRMVDQAEKANVTLSVNHVRRLYPAYVKIRELLRDGTLGKLKSIQYIDGEAYGWPTASGFYFHDSAKRGVLFDRGVHALDTLCWWLGGKPELISSENDAFDGVEGTALIRSEIDGCNIEIRLSWLVKLQNTYQITGELGMIEGNIGDWQTFNLCSNGLKKKVLVTCQEKDYYDFANTMLLNFMEVIQNGAKPLIPANEVIPTIEFVDECYQKATRLSMPWYDSLGIDQTMSINGNSAIARKDSTLGVEPNRAPEMSTSHGESKQTILVTGAGGFIGGWIAEELQFDNNFIVRAGIRKWASAARIARLPVKSVFCDILDQEQIAEALRGIDIIVHCAAGSRDVIVQGTQNMLSAAQQMGVQRFIYISTAAVYGSTEGNVNEDSPRLGKTDYAAAKIEAENLCWEFYRQGLPVTILRPSIVYGPFAKVWTMNYAQRLLSGHWGSYEEYGEGKCNLVYVKDLVLAVKKAIDNDCAVGQAFNINGPDIVTWNQYFRKFNDALGLPELKVVKARNSKLNATLTEPVRQLLGSLMGRYRGTVMTLYMRSGPIKKRLKQLRTTLSTTPSQRELEGLFSLDAYYTASKAHKLLGYEPRYHLETGLRQSVLWLNQNGIGLPSISK